MPDERALIAHIKMLEKGLKEAKATQAELRALMETLTAAPWHPASLLRLLEAPLAGRAVVAVGGQIRLVSVHPEVAPGSLARGDRVFLNTDQNLLLASAGDAVAGCGETAQFRNALEDGRLVVRARGEELVVDAAAALTGTMLAPDDVLRIDRSAGMAFERIEQSAGSGRRYLLDQVPDVDVSSVGGQDHVLQEIHDSLTLPLLEPELAGLYGEQPGCTILLVGPPGTGKTLIARVTAARIQKIGGRRCRFGVVRPGEFETPYVGETQENIRSCFATLHREAGDDLAVVFIDELESIGRIRGGLGGRHSDSFLAALLDGIDGFGDRGNVAVIAATNRADLLDPALRERFAGAEIRVGRPDLHGAIAILEVHLAADLPFDTSGAIGDALAVRREAVQTAVSRLYAPNAEAPVCELQFRDGSRRPVYARELLSGRILAQIAGAMRSRAFRRHAAGGGVGLRVCDAEEATSEALLHLEQLLSVRNVRAYLDDLPDDLDVVRVEPIRRKPAHRHRFVHAA